MAASFARSVNATMRQRHLLISYPLGALWMLTLGRTGAFYAGLDALVTAESGDVLEIHGTGDSFTSDSKYATWAKDLQAKAAAGATRFQSIEVLGAGHFWVDGATACSS